MARLTPLCAAALLGASIACGGPASASLEQCTAASQTVCLPRLVLTPGVPPVHQTFSRYGPIVVTDRGYAVYRFTLDAPGASACTGPCTDRWPPLLVPGGTRLTGSDLTTFRRPDGTLQLAYRGIPLYVFAGDLDQGDTYGEGVRDIAVWHLVRAADTAPDDPGP